MVVDFDWVGERLPDICNVLTTPKLRADLSEEWPVRCKNFVPHFVP